MTPAVETPPLLDVRNLSKSYGTLPALDRVSFSISRGDVVGLIGPNGAGKTTLLECLAGLIACDAGDVVTAGTVSSGPVSPRSIFYVPDGITPWESQPVGWVLRFFAALHSSPPSMASSLAAELGLAPIAHQSIGVLSRGQRKRVLIALGLLTRADLLLLDEPFDGLDLRQSRDVAELLRRHAGSGRTLFLSIHQLADAERVCDRMVLLSTGRVVGNGTLDELRHVAGIPGGSLEEIFLALT